MDRAPQPTIEPDPQRQAELDVVVGAWLTLREAAQRQGVSVAVVRRQLQAKQLVAVRRGQPRQECVPEVFVTPEGPRPELRGTITVLADGGMRDDEVLLWLFTADETLALPGSPMDALLAGHKRQVRRRAMEQAY